MKKRKPILVRRDGELETREFNCLPALGKGDIVTFPGLDAVEVMATKKQVEQATRNLAKQLTRRCKGPYINVVLPLQGAAQAGVRITDHLGELGISTIFNYPTASSYGSDRKSSGDVIIGDFCIGYGHLDAVVIDDVDDTTETGKKITDLLLKVVKGKVFFCTLCTKFGGEKVPLNPRVIPISGLQMPNRYLVGCGMNGNAKSAPPEMATAKLYRNLPFIGALLD